MNAGLTRMLEASKQRTPEERKALSAKAAAASAAASRKRKAEREAAKANAPTTTQETVQAAIVAPAASTEPQFDVCLTTDGKAFSWVRVQAGGFQRAMRAARKANPGTQVMGVLRAGIAK